MVIPVEESERGFNNHCARSTRCQQSSEVCDGVPRTYPVCRPICRPDGSTRAKGTSMTLLRTTRTTHHFRFRDFPKSALVLRSKCATRRTWIVPSSRVTTSTGSPMEAGSRTVAIPAGQPSYGTSAMLMEKTSQRVRDLIQDAAASTPPRAASRRKLATTTPASWTKKRIEAKGSETAGRRNGHDLSDHKQSVAVSLSRHHPEQRS